MDWPRFTLFTRDPPQCTLHRAFTVSLNTCLLVFFLSHTPRFSLCAGIAKIHRKNCHRQLPLRFWHKQNKTIQCLIQVIGIRIGYFFLLFLRMIARWWNTVIESSTLWCMHFFLELLKITAKCVLRVSHALED